jgi:hypothetical protein
VSEYGAEVEDDVGRGNGRSRRKEVAVINFRTKSLYNGINKSFVKVAKFKYVGTTVTLESL